MDDVAALMDDVAALMDDVAALMIVTVGARDGPRIPTG